MDGRAEYILWMRILIRWLHGDILIKFLVRAKAQVYIETMSGYCTMANCEHPSAIYKSGKCIFLEKENVDFEANYPSK